jgi:glycosyltransferase involved in cell wall biosynthesis
MDLLLTCYLNVGGLATATQGFYKCFVAEKFRVVPLFPVLPDERHVDHALAKEMMEASTRPVDPGPVHFHVGIPESLFLVKGRSALLLSTVVEGPNLTGGQLSACASADMVLAPSRFCMQAMLASGVPRRKLSLVPYPLDSSRWNPAVRPEEPPGERFKFLFMNTLYERKGLDVMLRAWWEEFSADDPVELTIKSFREDTRPAHAEGIVARVATSWRVNRALRAPVRVVDVPLDDSALPGFVRSFGALVSPHRAECFGMNPWHAMALGVPVICTDYGGPADFATEDTAWPVRVERMSSPSPDEVAIFPQFDGMLWAEPDVADLRRQMRACLLSPGERTKRAAAGSKLVASAYSPAVVMGGLGDAVRRRLPGTWEKLSSMSTVLEDQRADRFSSPADPLRMVEI